MNSIQIGSAASAPCLVGAERLLLVVADPDADGDVRIEADEPRVGVVVDRAGLAGERPLERHARRRAPVPRRLTTPRSRFVITNAVSARITSIGSERFSSSRLPSRSFTFRTVERLHPHALIRERRVGARHLEQRRVAGAERDRQVRREVLLEPEALRVSRARSSGPSASIILIAGMLRDSSSAWRSVTGPSNLWS